MTSTLEFQYEENAHVTEITERILDCVESISMSFDGYGRSELKGPGLYVAIATGRSVGAYADPMGTNRWPVETCDNVRADADSFYEAATDVATSCDGGVVVGVDGTILEQMVRFRNVTDSDLPEGKTLADIDYAGWMGARHMSAHEISLRPEVVTTVALSEETGRVTTFRDGEYESVAHEDIGTPWRGEE